MFQFPGLAAYDYVFIVGLGLYALRVSPFGNLRIIAC
jgi:hypothetical protein